MIKYGDHANSTFMSDFFKLHGISALASCIIVAISLFYSNYAIAFIGTILFCLFYFSKHGIVIIYSCIIIVFVLTSFTNIHLSNYVLIATPYIAYQSIYVILIAFYLLNQKSNTSNYELMSIYLSYVFFMFCVLATIAFSKNYEVSVDKYMTVFVMSSIILLSGIKILSEPSNRKIYELLMLCLLILVLVFSTYQFLTNSFGPGEGLRDPISIRELSTFERIRCPSFFMTSYAAAEFYGVFLPFVLYYRYKSTDKVKIYLTVIIMWLILGLIWSQQRTGIILIFTNLTLFHLLCRKNINISNMVRLLMGIALGTLVFFAILGMSESGVEMLDRLRATFSGILALDNQSLANVNDNNSLLVRLYRILIGWNIFLDNKVWGGGLGMSPDLYLSYGWIFKTSTGGAHNLYIYLLSETGIVGFTGFLVFLSVLTCSTISRYRASRNSNDIAAYASFICFLVTIVIDGMFNGIFGHPSINMVINGIAYMLSYKNVVSGEV